MNSLALAEKLRFAVTTMCNDDQSKPGTMDRDRHVARVVAMEEVAEALEAAATLRAEPAGVVKELEWVRHERDDIERHSAGPVFASYIITWTASGYELYIGFWGSAAERRPPFFSTLEAAKAHAQSDYETRIRSALTAPVSPVAVNAEMLEALTENLKHVRSSIEAANYAAKNGLSTREPGAKSIYELTQYALQWVADSEAALAKASASPEPVVDERMLSPEQEAEIVEDINSGRWPYLQPLATPSAIAPMPVAWHQRATKTDDGILYEWVDADGIAHSYLSKTDLTASTLLKRPFAFVIDFEEGDSLVLRDERVAQLVTERLGIDYHGLYRRDSSALATAPAVSEPWQTMDSAPKDGTEFLAYEKGRYFNCRVVQDPHEGGYYYMDDADSEPMPTDWRPLPAAPRPASGEQ